MGTSAPHIQSQVHRHRSNWRGLVVVLILAVVIALVGVSRMEALLRDLASLTKTSRGRDRVSRPTGPKESDQLHWHSE